MMAGGGKVTVKRGKLDQFLAKAKGLDKVYVKIGVLKTEGAEVHAESYDVRTPLQESRGEGHATPITMVELAAIHEFGSPAANIPERSFIRRTFAEPEGHDELVKMCAKLCKNIITNNLPVETALKMLGSWGSNLVKNRITRFVIPPPLKPATVAAKGSSRPLVDTGRMVQSISYEIVTGAASGAEGASTTMPVSGPGGSE